MKCNGHYTYKGQKVICARRWECKYFTFRIKEGRHKPNIKNGLCQDFKERYSEDFKEQHGLNKK